jgi:prolipoprotein diacylglyceryltransferase
MSFTLFGVLWSQRRKFEDIPGTIFGMSLVSLGIERFIAEFWRITPSVLGWMSAAQIFSIVAFVVGIAMIFWLRTRPRAVEVAVEGEIDTPRPRARSRRRRQRR